MENAEIIEKMAGISNLMIESLTEMKKIGENTMLELAKQHVNTIDGFSKVSTRQAAELATVKSPQELLNAQTEMATAMANDMKNHAVRVMAILSESQDQLRTFVEKNIQKFADSAKIAA